MQGVFIVKMRPTGGCAACKDAYASCKALRACKAPFGACKDASRRVKSRRDEILVASQFIGWYNRAKIIIGVP